MNPVIIYCCSGMIHLIYCVWSVRSLQRFDYGPIEILVNAPWEKDFIEKHLKGISCTVVPTERHGYGMWTFRPFALEQYQIKNRDRDVVICDADILWKKDPKSLFDRFKAKAWVHKITSLNPADFNMQKIPRSRLGLHMMTEYKKIKGLSVYPNFHLNCGLFMLPKDVFPKVLKRWVEMIRALPPREMLMTEALLSLVYAEMGLQPISDKNNIKYLDLHHDTVSVPLVSFQVADTPSGMFTGYETAQHYFGDQRDKLYKDVIALDLDPDNLLKRVKKEELSKKFRNIKKIPTKIINRLFNGC